MFAQFIDRDHYVEVKKRTKFYSDVDRERKKGSQYPGREFWVVTIKMRSNRTQTVESFTQETVYDRESGEKRLRERKSRENYATFFKRDPDHKGMLLMLSPEDGSVEATVCELFLSSLSPGRMFLVLSLFRQYHRTGFWSDKKKT